MTCFAIVPAAGVGQRFGGSQPKQYALIDEHCVLEKTLKTLTQCPLIDRIVVVLSSKDTWFSALKVAQHPKIQTTQGGTTRFESVTNGLAAVENDVQKDDWILVHDAARCFLTLEALTQFIQTMSHEAVGGLLVSPSINTLKQCDDAGAVVKTIPREHIVQAQTPQMFRAAVLTRAFEHAQAQQTIPTDEAQAVEWIGLSPQTHLGSEENIKVTYPNDVTNRSMMTMRIGSGYDLHRFVPTSDLSQPEIGFMCGGVFIAHDKVIQAHSDGDVLLHALCDALYGAIGQGDIGEHFSDNDAQWANQASEHFVHHASTQVRQAGYQVVNVDATIILQTPKLSPFKAIIKSHIATLLQISADCVSIKAKTNERLDAIGEGLAIAAQVTVLLQR